MSRYRFALASCLLGFGYALTAFAALPAQASDKPQKTETAMLLADHPLAGSLWHTTGEKVTDMDAFAKELQKADFLLLGEKHDNERHHILQSTMVSFAGASGRKGQIVAEMIEPKYGSVLDTINSAFLKDESKTEDLPALHAERDALLASLGDDLEWEKRGWPSWDSYRDIFRVGLGWQFPIKAGNPDRETLMSVGRGGELGADLLHNLPWDQDYDKAQRESLLDELVESHCGMMGRESMAPLVTLQRLKDAHMARAMREGASDNGLSILIAGNGHTRKDRGIPYYLDKDKTILSVAIIEVVRGESDPSTYPAFDPKLYDYVWFTPRVDEIDPCEKFREQLEQMKKKMKAKPDAKGHGS